MESYLKFDKFITPTFIQIIFWVGVAGIVLTTLFYIGTMSSFGGGGLIAIMGLFVMVVWLTLWRVYCEIMLVIFRIHAELQLIRTQGAFAPGATRPPTV